MCTKPEQRCIVCVHLAARSVDSVDACRNRPKGIRTIVDGDRMIVDGVRVTVDGVAVTVDGVAVTVDGVADGCRWYR